MKKITLERLLEESGKKEYGEQYEEICRRIREHRLIPVKKSPLNGKKPALHLSYWIVEEEPDYKEEIEELKFRMSPAISTDYYFNHLKTYREEAKWVRLLNRYLTEQQEPAYVSVNERSFQIWGREKFLQREQGRTVLAHCGIRMEQLRVYGTTEPLAYYSASRRIPQTILILENKDTFYSMRRYLLEEEKPHSGGPGKIFGEEIGTLVYGGGKGILRSFEDFSLCVEPHVNARENEILYFGDLDYEGIGIYERLADSFQKESSGIRPFVPAYTKMLEKARCRGGTDFLPETSEGQNQNLSGRFFQYFSEQEQEEMKRILQAGKYIPQEIVNITDYHLQRTGEQACSTNF